MSSNKLLGFKLDIPFWVSVMNGDRSGPGYAALRGVLSGAAAAHAVGLKVYLASERAGIRHRTILPVPVISIGNLTSGGTGKTPMAQYIADGLLREGFRPSILSRGHGGTLSTVGAQVSDSEGNVLLTSEQAGDEAAALARLIPGVPVFVGKDRRKSALSAFAEVKPDVIVLDDGLQYWQLARDLDIILLDSRKPFDNGHLLPRGRLREPKTHLRRAGIVVITRADLATAEQLDRAIADAEALARNAPVFLANHRFAGFRPLNERAERQLPVRPLAVCGIAQPKAFAALLESAGADVAADRFIALDDHAVYDNSTVDRIKGKIIDRRADSLITTEKDAVKLPISEIDVPAYAVDLQIEIDRPAEFWQELIKRAKLITA